MAREKVRGRLTRNPFRFTAMRRKLIEGLRDLIGLYYLLKNNEPFVSEMKNFLGLLTERDIYFGDELRSEGFVSKIREVRRTMSSEYNRPEIDDILRGKYFMALKEKDCNLIYFDDLRRTSFLTIMEKLQESIAKGIINHFFAVKWTWKNETFIDPPEIPISREDISEGILKRPLDVNKSIPQSFIYKQAKMALHKQQRQEQEYFISGLNWKQLKGKDMGVKVLSIPYRSYEVQPITDFGVNLLQMGRIVDFSARALADHDSLAGKRNLREIPSINFDGWYDFIQIVQSLLVDYHIVFGDYARIKTCEWCTKLFVQEKANKGRFCSPECQQESSRKSEPIERYRCRNRQNIWFLRRTDEIKKQIKLLCRRYQDIPACYPTPVRFWKSDCKSCDTYPDGGECMALNKKNQKVLSILEELRAIEKELPNPRKERDVISKINKLKDLLRDSD